MKPKGETASGSKCARAVAPKRVNASRSSRNEAPKKAAQIRKITQEQYGTIAYRDEELGLKNTDPSPNCN